jgi:membrane protein DedA with SNARE-associated domain
MPAEHDAFGVEWNDPMLSHDQLHQLFQTYGVWTVALIVGLESLGIPLPGETVLVIASIYAATHGGNIALVISAAVIGAIIGDNIGYWIGREFGYRLLLKYGAYIGVTEDRIKLGQYLFMKHGGKVVFFGRFFALLRFLAAVLAGINRMVWSHFLVANALGAVVWATIVGMAAYTAGRSIHLIQGPVAVLAAVIVVGVIVAGFFYLRRNEALLEAEAKLAFPGPVTGFREKPKQKA